MALPWSFAAPIYLDLADALIPSLPWFCLCFRPWYLPLPFLCLIMLLAWSFTTLIYLDPAHFGLVLVRAVAILVLALVLSSPDLHCHGPALTMPSSRPQPSRFG